MKALSEIRKEILEIISSEKKPLSAKLIQSRIRHKPDLSTIYRALDFFESGNYIRSISISGTKLYYLQNKDGHGHFLSCRECREIIEFKECAVAGLKDRLQDKFNYEITGHAIFFEGICQDCRRYLSKKAGFQKR